MTIGERIKKLREDKGISQTELADIIKTTKQNLYKYENNIITNIPSDKIEAIAKYFNISPSYIMGWEDNLERGLSKAIEYLQKEVNIFANLEEVYGKDIKDLVCRATELNELGISKLYVYCCDLLEVPKYLKSPPIENVEMQQKELTKESKLFDLTRTENGEPVDQLEVKQEPRMASYTTESIPERVSPEAEAIANRIIEQAKKEELQRKKKIQELYKKAEEDQRKNGNRFMD